MCTSVEIQKNSKRHQVEFPYEYEPTVSQLVQKVKKDLEKL